MKRNKQLGTNGVGKIFHNRAGKIILFTLKKKKAISKEALWSEGRTHTII